MRQQFDFVRDVLLSSICDRSVNEKSDAVLFMITN